MGAVRGRASSTLSLALLVLLAFAQLASASFASIKAQQDKQKTPATYGGQEIVPGSFLIEVGGSSLSKRASGAADLTQVLSHLASPPSSTGKPFSLPSFSTSRTLAARPSLFNGAAVKVTDPALLQKLKEGSESIVKQILQELEGVDGISRAWPLRILPRPSAVLNKDEGGGFSSGSASFAASLASSLAKRRTTFPPASAYLNDAFDPHVMTGVDKLHNQGILGSNAIKVGILDTGVDYLNPILGGCFGPGCHISFGGDYTVDPPGSDLGALANPLGFSGVAPNVQIGHYKVFRCSGGVPEDVLVAALTAATNDNVDVVVVERMTSQEGIVATVSAGNSRSEGLFFAESPAALGGGISIGSVDVEQLPAYPAQLSSTPVDISSLPASRNGYRLSFTSTTTTVADDACNPLPDSTPDLSNMITVVRRGTYSFYSKMANIAAKGGKVALVYNSPNADTMVPYYRADGTSLAAVAALRYEEGAKANMLLGWYNSRPRGLYISFPQDAPLVTVADNIRGGLMSLALPSELFCQPTLSGPGGNILSTFPLALGGLGVISAGASALLLSQRKADDLSPADVRALLSSTASKRETAINGTTFETVLLQGGGLVQVDKAISTRTIVSPFELMLNDSAFPAHTQTIMLLNTNSFPMQYSVSTSSAQAYGTYDNGASTDVLTSTNPKPVYPQSGQAAFSTQRLRLQAGQTYTFTVTIPQPRFNAMTVARFPLHSGYVDISGVSVDRKHSEELHIPYFGLAAATSDMPVLDSTATFYDDVAYPFIANSDYSIFDAPGSLSGFDTYSILFRRAAGTRFGSVDIIRSSDAPPTTIPTERILSTPPNRMARRSRKADLEERDTASHAAHPISPRDLEARGPSAALYSDTPIVGTIESASPLPRDYLVDSPAEVQQYSEFIVPFTPDYSSLDLQDGTEYRVLIRALRTTADPKLASSYESWVSYPFTIFH
ncbi:hypothetical protein JCM10296v2_004286 [Rhodotorula toruloides]